MQTIAELLHALQETLDAGEINLDSPVVPSQDGEGNAHHLRSSGEAARVGLPKRVWQEVDILVTSGGTSAFVLWPMG